MKWIKNGIKDENGEVMLESLIVYSVTIFLLFFILAIFSVLFQRWNIQTKDGVFMTIRFDKEDDLFVIPTIVISKIDTKYVKTTNIHIAWLRYSLVFICQNSDTANTKKEKDEKYLHLLKS